ncbi:MAG: transglycosylase domain-containing protein [Methylibium sp.]|uniref:transglycosylase domain-containing protein n=1 Tax=Methylibium sp. TaxID=2067992 RepID=UPI0018242A96|nr:transglycosylase domain-containing protein [Methylibium sp.]MBA2721927.1 transglycosylase domain-containing protein [Methylibium sp.]MBA3591282.1 transglycosylase domain-containing protein [Methylibium sp.]MBA3625525.1 transglycosylase domain-containing protein [Methylibium sp.]
MKRTLVRAFLLLLLSAVALQLVFVLRIAAMLAFDPQSTAFQRTELRRLLAEPQPLSWSQEWRAYERIAAPLKRAVIASEDAGFTDHAGVDWEAIEHAWERNQRAEARSDRLRAQAQATQSRLAASGRTVAARPAPAPRIVGGSTITQQLAKNLLLSSERSLARKGQEFVLATWLELLLGKERILEIYLNNVEWGEGVFGAQAAARRYYRTDADRLGATQAARLAVMLPAPKRFEKRPGSAYVSGRAATIVARMSDVELP